MLSSCALRKTAKSAVVSMVIIRVRVTLGVLLDLQLNELLEVW